MDIGLSVYIPDSPLNLLLEMMVMGLVIPLFPLLSNTVIPTFDCPQSWLVMAVMGGLMLSDGVKREPWQNLGIWIAGLVSTLPNCLNPQFAGTLLELIQGGVANSIV